jgi:hypothetical protein
MSEKLLTPFIDANGKYIYRKKSFKDSLAHFDSLTIFTYRECKISPKNMLIFCQNVYCGTLIYPIFKTSMGIDININQAVNYFYETARTGFIPPAISKFDYFTMLDHFCLDRFKYNHE